MSSLGRVIVEAIVLEYGRDEVLRRLAHPFWFQSFGAVMGMDWHSSGITTSVLGALKRGLQPLQHELGLYVCGGRGKHSRKTPDELLIVGEKTGLDAAPLVRASKLVAKVDHAAVQDGFDLYLHGFIVTSAGKWCVVQQGMSDVRGEARRYHWLSENLTSFLDSPHAAIEGPNQGVILNLADERADASRRAGLDLVHSGPDRTVDVLRGLRNSKNVSLSLFPEMTSTPRRYQPPSPYLRMPAHHEVRASDVVLKRLHGVLAAAADRGPTDFAELLLTPGVGARTVASLALVAEVIHGAPSRFSDPARFSMAHGGKDGHPSPCPCKVYDETIRVLKGAVIAPGSATPKRSPRSEALDDQARVLERATSGPTFDEYVRAERELSRSYDGRTVVDRLRARSERAHVQHVDRHLIRRIAAACSIAGHDRRPGARTRQPHYARDHRRAG